MENGGTVPQGPLAPFQLKDVEDTGKEVSVGTYGRAVEVLYKGLRCVARKFADHEKPEKGSDGAKAERLREECLLLSQLRHPHIVQFLGTYFESDLPILVMEYLPTTLAKCLESYGVFPQDVSYSVLRDVALGLVYLHGHSPPVVHGCLSAACVLLAWDMTAKIGDVGVAQLQHERRQTQCKKGDLYSYGVLMIHTLNGKLPTQFASNHKAAADKTYEFPKECVGDHALSSLISQCISRSPQTRPEASQILATVTEMMPQLSSASLESRLEILYSVQIGLGRMRVSPGHSPLKSPSGKKQKMAQLVEVEYLKLQLDELQIENKVLKNSLSKQKSLLSARDQEMAAKLMAKDQEIFTKQQELLVTEASVEGYATSVAAKEAMVQGLSKQLRHLQGCLMTRDEPHLLSPKAQLRWRQCAYLPNGMVFAQAVAIGETVYFGSGTSTIGDAAGDCPYKILKYNSTWDKWSPITDCPVVGFGMVEYNGKLTLVGGAYESSAESSSSPYALTNDVHVLDENKKEWKKSVPPMPTPRLLPTTVSFESRIIACGGIVLDESHDICVSTVEVFDGEKKQWYRADPLPLACIGMSSAIIDDDCYLLGGFTDTDFDHPTHLVFTVSLTTLIEDAIKKHVMNGSHPRSPVHIWQKFPDAPRYASTAANIGGCLLALGGSDERLEHKSGALHVYSPLTSSWIRIEDIPVACFSCTVTKLGSGDILIIGGMGHDEEDALKTVYRGSICAD